MKHGKLLVMVGLLAAALGGGCSSGKRALEKGNYDEAVLRAVNRLRASPNNEKARSTLRQAYDLSQGFHRDEIGQLTASAAPFRWEGVARSYDQLNRLADEIRRCPACLTVVGTPPTYLNEAGEAKSQAAAERYEAGTRALEAGKTNRQMAREAFQHFLTAEQLVPNFRDARVKADEARFYATLKVVVEQVVVGSRQYNLSNEFFQNKINEFLATNRRLNEFVRFYTPQEATAERLARPDHVIRLQFDDFTVGQAVYVVNTETVTSADSVKVGEVKIDGVNRPVLNKVTAKLTTNKKTLISRGLLDMQIFDPAGNRVVYQNKYPGEFVWNTAWANFNGDERALTAEQRRLCSLREATPPAPPDLFVEFCRPIYDQVTGQIRQFYRNF